MWDVLKEYPAARVRLEAIAVKRLEKYKRAPLEKGKYTFFLALICYKQLLDGVVNISVYLFFS